MTFLFLLHPLYILPEDIELDIDRATDSESSDIGHVPCMWDERYSQVVISCSHDREAHTIECDTSLLDDEIAILAIKIHTDEVRVITVANYLCNRSDCVDMSRDEVSIDASLCSDTALDVEYIPDFFTAEVRPSEALLHRKECIILRCDGYQSHTDSIMCDTLSDGEWFIVEVILHHEVAILARDDTRCVFDNSGEQGRRIERV